MKKLPIKYFLSVTIFISSSGISVAQELFTIGPMVHFSIGNKFRPAYGLEVAYWNYSHFPYSVDLGIEYEKSKFRIYSEAQTGIAVTGASAGLFIEFEKQAPVQVGLQGTAWANYFLGIDYRFRIMTGKNYFAPGVYAKVPLMKGGSGSNSHHHHYHWD